MASAVPKKILVLTRRQDMMNYSVNWATELGFEAHGAFEQEKQKDLIASKHKFDFCCFGCQFVNDKVRAQRARQAWATPRGEANLSEGGAPFVPAPPPAPPRRACSAPSAASLDSIRASRGA